MGHASFSLLSKLVMKDLVHATLRIKICVAIVHGVYVKEKYLKSSFKQNKKVDIEESDLISNIFDNANLGNIVDEPGSHLTIIDAPAAGDTGLTHGLGYRRNNRAIRTLRVWYIFGGNFVV